MKIYVYFLTFLLTFAPVYANAVLPLVTAVAGSTAGRLVVTKGGESFLRTLAPSALAKMGKNVVGICAKNSAALLACGVITSAIRGDGWTIKVNNTNNDDVDVEIYKKTSGNCWSMQYKKDANDNYWIFNNLPTADLACKSLAGKTVWLDGYHHVDSIYYHTGSGLCIADLSQPKYNSYYKDIGLGTPIRSDCPVKKIYMQDYEIKNYFTKNVSDNDITNIYNYDYSKHQNIKINNNTEYGDTVNNYKNDIDSNNPDKKVTQNVVDKAKAKNPDYDPDKINDTNCDKDDTGAYDKCGADRDNDDDTASTPASTPNPTDPPKDDEDDDPPIECNSSGFYKKVCDFVDWFQDEPTKPTDEKSPIKDIEAQNSNKIDMSGSCPAPYQINFSVFGHSQNNSISYQPLCDALEMLKPIFVGAGALSSMFILMGYSRPNSTGVND